MIKDLLIFLAGLLFGAGGFYQVTLFRLNKQDRDYDDIKRTLQAINQEIKNLSDRVSKLEGMLCHLWKQLNNNI